MQTLPSASDCHKALGLHWDTARDKLHISTPELLPICEPTMHQIVSGVAKVYDILGWLFPVIIKGKILLQKLWDLKVSWDEKVPCHIQKHWKKWRDQPPILTQHPVDRCYFSSSLKRQALQLHSFSDASQSAYAAVVYLRVVYEDTTIATILVASKTEWLLSKGLPFLDLSYVEHYSYQSS